MYKTPKYHKSTITSIEKMEGETIENKIERIVNNGEPITDGAPIIYTERKDGVISAYDVRTDRWEIATDAMDKVTKMKIAKAEERAQEPKGKVVDMNPQNESPQSGVNTSD